MLGGENKMRLASTAGGPNENHGPSFRGGLGDAPLARVWRGDDKRPPAMDLGHRNFERRVGGEKERRIWCCHCRKMQKDNLRRQWGCSCEAGGGCD